MMIVCLKCEKFFHPYKNGVIVEEGMPITNRTTGEEKWVSYKLWRADEVVCRSCDTHIVAGFAHHPFMEHYMEHYAPYKAQLEEANKLRAFIKDCI